MSTPVTRGELQEELAQLATNADLERWRRALQQCFDDVERRLQAEVARHAGAL
jgi:hypothetical protein